MKLSVVWWNTSLSPPRRTATKEQRNIVCAMLKPEDYADALRTEIKIDTSSINLKDFQYENNTRYLITASNPQKRKDVMLAEWNQGRLGYPCSIKFGGTKFVCEDKQALENALADLLADPIVAGKIMQLIQQ